MALGIITQPFHGLPGDVEGQGPPGVDFLLRPFLGTEAYDKIVFVNPEGHISANQIAHPAEHTLGGQALFPAETAWMIASMALS